MKRPAVSGLAAGLILILMLTLTVGTLAYTDTYGVGGSVSSGLALVKAGLGFAAGRGLAQVEVSSVGLLADTFTGIQPLAPTCSTASKNSYVALTNLGSESATAQSITITYGGAENEFSIAGACAIGPAGSSSATTYVLFGGPSMLPNSLAPQPSLPYYGTVSLSNGAKLPFSGKFFQGYPVVTVASVVFPAAGFGAGKSGNATCSSSPNVGRPYVELTNAGTVGASFVQVSVAWKNATIILPVSGTCIIGPDGTPSSSIYVLLGKPSELTAPPETGQPFTGSVSFPSGTQVPFSGNFQ